MINSNHILGYDTILAIHHDLERNVTHNVVALQDKVTIFFFNSKMGNGEDDQTTNQHNHSRKDSKIQTQIVTGTEEKG
jgi:hypothetical protein